LGASRRPRIDRWECGFLSNYRGDWLLVYGRRKTGKTWLLRRCVEWGLYATVSLAGECLLDNGERVTTLELGECVKRVGSAVKRGATVVLDEFQRLPIKYWDYLGLVHGESEGLLIACGSSMGIVKKVFDRRSPLLGVFEAFRVDLATVADTVASLADHGLGSREAVLWAPIARDPWLLAHIVPEGEPWAKLAEAAPRLAPVARGLVGEVFVEEERRLTRLYESVLELLASGFWRAADIAQHLHSLGLVSEPHPGMATGVLSVLESMGLVERVPLWRTRGARVYYRHRSSLVALLYHVYGMYDAGEPIQPQHLALRYGVELQFNIGELLAGARGLRRAYAIMPGGRDIDIVLLDRGSRPQIGYEVKAGPISGQDAVRAVEAIRAAGIPRAGLISAQQRPPLVGDESLGPEDILEIAREQARKYRGRA